MHKKKTLLLICGGHLVGHWYVGILMLIIPILKADFGLTFTQVALIVSLRSLSGAFGNTTSGLIVDLVGRRNLILTISSAGVGLCWFVVGFAQSYLLLLIFLPLATTFSNLWHAPAMSVLSETYPRERGFALGMHGAAANLGQAMSPLIVGVLITWVGWRSAISWNVLPGCTMAVLLAVLLPHLGAFDFKPKSRAAFLRLFREHILKNPSLFMISMVSVFRTMGQRTIETFLALFLADRVGLDPIIIGVYLSVLAFSSTFPEPLIGWLSDRVGRRMILIVSFVMSAAAVTAVLLVPPGIPLMISVGLLGFFHYSLRPIIFAFALDVTPPEIGATTISYVFTWNQTFSAAAPLIGGLLADAFGLGATLMFIVALTLAAALISGLLRTGAPAAQMGT